MTGEITLRGRVLPIGGLKEKLLAAKVTGIKTVCIPKDNEKDLEEISKEITDGMENRAGGEIFTGGEDSICKIRMRKRLW